MRPLLNCLLGRFCCGDHGLRDRRTHLILQALEDRSVPAVFTVTNANDAGPDSLRDCVDQANSTAGADDIVFGALFNVPQTITLTTGEIAITEDINIKGPGAGLLTVSGNNAGRVFNTSAAPGWSSIAVSGITLTGGLEFTGGAIYALDEGITLSGCVITGNKATLFGAAVAVEGGGTLTVVDST